MRLLKEPPREQDIRVTATQTVGTLGLPMERPREIHYRWAGTGWQAQNAFGSGGIYSWDHVCDYASAISVYREVVTRTKITMCCATCLFPIEDHDEKRCEVLTLLGQQQFIVNEVPRDDA